MSVRVWGNPAPFALGTSLVSWETIALGGTYICPSVTCTVYHYTGQDMKRVTAGLI